MHNRPWFHIHSFAVGVTGLMLFVTRSTGSQRLCAKPSRTMRTYMMQAVGRPR